MQKTPSFWILHTNTIIFHQNKRPRDMQISGKFLTTRGLLTATATATTTRRAHTAKGVECSLRSLVCASANKTHHDDGKFTLNWAASFFARTKNFLLFFSLFLSLCLLANKNNDPQLKQLVFFFFFSCFISTWCSFFLNALDEAGSINTQTHTQIA